MQKILTLLCDKEITKVELNINSRLVGLVAHTMVVHLAKELNAKNAVQRHEEQEEDGDIVDLLAGSSAPRTKQQSLILPHCLTMRSTYNEVS